MRTYRANGLQAVQPTVEAVYFDIGETILDRTREYQAWAGWLGVPAHTFSAVFGALISRGHPVADVIAHFRSTETFASIHHQMTAAGAVPELADIDVYPQVRETLARLRTLGLFVGIAGNQPAVIGDQLRALHLPADLIAVSSEWGVSKPAPEFFERAAQLAGCRPSAVLYVGDQLDNDVLAPLAAGMQVVRVLTGPWGELTRDETVEARCLAVLPTMSTLPGLLAEIRAKKER
jgi:HAD superfamily hydrolase (TIGR01549 family)